MDNKALIRLFWGERRETAVECAFRLKSSLDRLALISPYFEYWYHGIDGPGQTDNAHLLDAAQLIDFMANGRDKIAPKKMADELGFSVRCLYSYGAGDNEIGKLSVSCAGYNYGPYGPFNRVILNIPYGECFISRNEIVKIFQTLIEIWEPSWGNIWTDEITDSVPEMPAGVPEMGWMLFLENERGVLPKLKPEFSVIKINSGNIIITGEEPPSVERNEGIKHLHQLHSELFAAGLLNSVHNY